MTANPIITNNFLSSDLILLTLSSLHILFSFFSILFLLLRTICSHPHTDLHHSSQQYNPLIIRINSLWFVRLLLLIFASSLSLSELLRLPLPFLRTSYLCDIYYLSSQSFSQPAFLYILLFLIRSPTSSTPSHPFSAFFLSLASSIPFLFLHSLFLFSASLSLVPSFLIPRSLPDRCVQSLFATMLLGVLGCIYIPLFVSACWSAAELVINKRLRQRIYVLASAVVLGLSMQVVALALSVLWNPERNTALWLDAAGFVSVIGCVVVGEVILVVLPVVDAKAAVEINGGRKVETRV